MSTASHRLSIAAAPVVWTPVACALCGADVPELVLVDPVRRGTTTFPFQVVRCRRCHFVYVSPRGTGAVFGNEAGGAARRDAASANAPLYRNGVALLHRHGLPPGARILDLGCAYGEFLEYAAAGGYRVTGVDLNPALADAARRRGFDVRTGDLRSLEIEAAFDALTMWDVIEHVDDPVAVLRAAGEVVIPGGLVLMHTGNAWFQIPKAKVLRAVRPAAGPALIPFQHVSHFDPHSAARLVQAAGLELVAIRPLGTLYYRRRWKRIAMGALNALGALPWHMHGPLLTNAMGILARRPATAAGERAPA